MASRGRVLPRLLVSAHGEVHERVAVVHCLCAATLRSVGFEDAVAVAYVAHEVEQADLARRLSPLPGRACCSMRKRYGPCCFPFVRESRFRASEVGRMQARSTSETGITIRARSHSGALLTRFRWFGDVPRSLTPPGSETHRSCDHQGARSALDPPVLHIEVSSSRGQTTHGLGRRASAVPFSIRHSTHRRKLFNVRGSTVGGIENASTVRRADRRIGPVAS